MTITVEILFDIFHFLFGFTLGFAIGIFVNAKTRIFDKIKMSDFIAFMVVVIWAISMVVDILSPEYETSPLVQGLMGAIVGFFYKQRISDKKNP